MRRKKEAKAYQKEQLIHSKQFTPVQQNILSTLLDTKQPYTLVEATTILNKYLNQEVQ